MKPFDIKAKRPLIISGPCSAETEEQTLETCRQIAATGLVDVLRAGIWKPRTKPGSFEGVGLKGLAWMSKARELTGLSEPKWPRRNTSRPPSNSGWM